MTIQAFRSVTDRASNDHLYLTFRYDGPFCSFADASSCILEAEAADSNYSQATRLAFPAPYHPNIRSDLVDTTAAMIY